MKHHGLIHQQKMKRKSHNLAITALERETQLELIYEQGKNELNGLLGQLGVRYLQQSIGG